MIETIRPDLFRIEVPLPDSPLKSLNSYVFRSSHRNLVIDTGLNHIACYEAMQAGLQELNIDLGRTDFFITHLHADHFGLISKLNTEGGVVYFNRPEAELIEVRGSWVPMVDYAAQNGFPKDEIRNTIAQHPGRKFSSEWVPDLNILQDGDPIHIGAYDFICLATPGHSLGHMCLYEPKQKILVAGDHILEDITPNIQCWTDARNPLNSYLNSLDRVYDLEIDLVLPGHRRIIFDHRSRINQLKAHHKERLDEILDILGSDDMSAYEVASEMSWNINCDSWEAFPPAQKWFAMGEAISHLRFLEEEGRITRVVKENLFRFAGN